MPTSVWVESSISVPAIDPYFVAYNLTSINQNTMTSITCKLGIMVSAVFA